MEENFNQQFSFPPGVDVEFVEMPDILYYDPDHPEDGAVQIKIDRFREPITKEEYLNQINQRNIEKLDIIQQEEQQRLTNKPRWEEFVAFMLSNEDFNNVMKTAFQNAPAAAIGLPTAFAQLSTHGVGQFSQIYPIVIQAGNATEEMRNTWRQYAENCKLPVEFVNLI